VLRAATERLKARRATPRTEIKDTCIGEARLKDCKERLPNAVGKRTRPRLRDLKEASAERSRNDANLLGHPSALPREEDGGRPAAKVGLNQWT
jgi:hypothetical protein